MRAPFDLYVITDPVAPRGLAPYVEALEAGVPGWALAVRDHHADDASIARTIEGLAPRGQGVPRLLAAASPERVRLAARLGVGVQLPERGPRVDDARATLGQGAFVAASVHDQTGFARRAHEGVDVALLAPFGVVSGKGPPLIDDAVRAITKSHVPVLALGAVRSRTDVDRAFALGCAGIAVRSWLAEATDGARAIAELRAWVDAARQERDSARGSR